MEFIGFGITLFSRLSYSHESRSFTQFFVIHKRLFFSTFHLNTINIAENKYFFNNILFSKFLTTYCYFFLGMLKKNNFVSVTTHICYTKNNIFRNPRKYNNIIPFSRVFSNSLLVFIMTSIFVKLSSMAFTSIHYFPSQSLSVQISFF